MKIDLFRKYRKDGYTIGKLSINGKYICDTLEDTDRGLTDEMSRDEIEAKKEYGETAIPTGTYKVIVNYSTRFKKNMPLICGVKGFEGVRIHSGNTPKDTLGCILCGRNTVVGGISESRIYTDRVYGYINQGVRTAEGVTIVIHW